MHVPGNEKRRRPTTSLTQALSATNEYLDAHGMTVPLSMEQISTNQCKKLEAELKKPLNIHAEMQVLFFLLDSERNGIQPFPYLGISKKKCLLCGHFIADLPDFETRGNHGKIYPQWTLPRQVHLQERYQAPIEAAKLSLMRRVVSLASVQDQLRPKFIKESSAGLSTIFNPASNEGQSLSHLYHQKAERQKMEHSARWIENMRVLPGL